MAELTVANTDISNLKNVVKDFSVQAQETDGVRDTPENTWVNDRWATQLGYYKSIPEINAVIDVKATWTIGKGFKADEQTEMDLSIIRGWGADTFNTILENMIRTYHIGGDAFAEIIRDKENNLINLKPLNPSTVKIVVGKNGLIKRYERIDTNKLPVRFQPEEIFHIARNRVADEIHGVSMVDILQWIVDAKNESMRDMRTLQHRHVKPINVFKLDTDDPTKISAFKEKADLAVEDGENLYIPMGSVEQEVISIPTNATLSPLAWLEYLDNRFYEAAGVPRIITGNGQTFTEASSKISYLVYQQTIEEEQLYIEEQVLSQLNKVIELEFPASLENELLSDKAKDGAENIDASETTAGSGE